jgi:hypothetical protein
MRYQFYGAAPSRRSRGDAIAQRLTTQTVLVSLGAGTLGALILAVVSGGLLYSQGVFVVQDQVALGMAIVVGVIEALLTLLFKTAAFEARADDSLLPLYMANSGVIAERRPKGPIHFRSSEVNQLKSLAHVRYQRW